MFFESIGDVLAELPSRETSAVQASATVAAAVAVMTGRNAEVLIVMNGPRFAGLVTTKSVLAYLAARQRDAWLATVSDIVGTARPPLPARTHSVQALRWMDDHGCDHVAVEADTDAPRVLSRRDLAEWTIRHQQQELDCAIAGARTLGYANRRA